MRKNNYKSVFNTIKAILKISYRECPVYLMTRNIMWVAYASVQCLFIVMLQKMYDSAWGKGFSWKNFIICALLFGFIMILNEIFLAITNVMTEDSGFVVQKNFAMEMHQKIEKIDAIEFENEKFLDGIKKAQDGIENATYFMNVIAMILCYHIPYLVFISFYLMKQKPVLLLLLLMIFVPILIMQGIKMKIYSKVADDTANTKRAYHYYEKCLCGTDYFKENRMLGAVPYFRKKYVETLQQFQGQMWKTAKKDFLISVSLEGLTFFGYVGVIIFMVFLVCRKEISISVFYAVFTSFGNMFEIIQGLLCFYIGKVSEQFGSITHLVEFLNYKEMEEKDYREKDFDKIELSHVSFSYPESPNKAIDDINLEIKKGETVAVVGENGSGKTTLVKLLAGIYHPDCGEISFKKLKSKERKGEELEVSGVYQKFGRYKLTLEENISFGKEEFDRGKAKKDMQKLQLNISGADNKLFDTVLSNEFGGIDLSGGQWQKIAILRGMNQKYQLLFLDEPTSAIDAIEESNMYNIFEKMSEHATVFIVTHRLGLTKIADKIIFLEKGKLKEVGTHEELMKKKGGYARMWNMQTESYHKI